MTFIKKLVMQGFKSFASRTEVPFENTLNIILGPNGAGKSNVSDALCFVLGRLSIKSMRASKASNLIHNGGKTGSPSEEATVEIILDNSRMIFPLDKPEVNISRTVRKNGNSIYKINGAVKTRQEVLELLAQAGIDPNGFNIILQQEISKFIEMHPEERRQIIEQVAGISVYEDKKHKSLLELNRTDEKMKEVRTILNERASYLKNLEKDRKEAMSYNKLKEAITKDKAALLFRGLEEKRAEEESVNKMMDDKQSQLEKMKSYSSDTDTKREALSKDIDDINKHIEVSTGIEQEKLHKEIAEEKVEVAAMSIRLENQNQQLDEMDRRKEQLEKEINQNLKDIEQLKSSLPKELKAALSNKTENFSSLEEKKAKLDGFRTELVKIKNTIHNKKQHYSYLVQRINELHSKISDLEKNSPKPKDGIENVINKIKSNISEISDLEGKRHSFVNDAAGHKREISLLEKLKKDMRELDSCPVCLRKVTKDHVDKVHSNSDADIKKLRKKLDESLESHGQAENRIAELRFSLESLRSMESELRIYLVNEKNLNEKRNEKKLVENERENINGEISALEKKASNLDIEIKKFGDIDRLYSDVKDELKEMSKKKDEREKLLLEISLKERDIERMKHIIKRGFSEKGELEKTIEALEGNLSEKQEALKENEEKEKKVYEKYQQMFKRRNELQDRLREMERRLMDQKFKINGIENEINVLRITKAKVNAEVETLSGEFEQYKNLDIESLKIRQSKTEIEARIKRNEVEIIRLGSVNMKALEVYEKVREEYEKINEKVAKLEEEKSQIFNIIESIDRKKKSSFLKVFDELNNGFSKNILTLAAKDAYLVLENKESPFEGGVDIVVRLGKGKYLDISSLSGGERTMAALSLIFAIQEMKPYHFYIFDEIDAALDKRNSERLGSLLKTYINNAQYIVITHNDSLISESPVLFGVSMQEGKSKVLSLKV